MADYKYKPSIVIDDLVSGLKNLKQEAVSAEKVISMIGNRGNLNKLLTTFLQMSNVIEGLTADSDQLKASLGGQLKGGYLKNLDDTFGRLSELINKTRGLGENVLNIDLRKSDAKAQLKSLAKQIDVELDTLGMNKIDFKLFNEASLKDQRDMLIKHINQIGSEITVSVGKIDTSNISALGDGIADGFDGAGKKIKDSGKKLSQEVMSQINELTAKNKELQKLKKQLEETAKFISNVKSKGSSAIPDEFGLKESEITVDNMNAILDDFDSLNQKIKDGNLSTEEYVQSLMQLADLTMKIQKSFATIKSNDALKNMFINTSSGGRKGDNLYQALMKYAGGSADQYNKIIKASQDDVIGKAVSANTAKIKEMSSSASAAKSVSSTFKTITSGADKASGSVQKLMYHLGNLLDGKGSAKDTFGDMAYNLTEGPMGTRWEEYGFGVLGGGLFGVTDPSTITQEPGHKSFIQSIDLSKYNMYMADTEERATDLIDFLSKLQKFSMKSAEPKYDGFDDYLDGVDIDSLYDQAKVLFEQSNLTKDKFSSFVNEMTSLLKQAGLSFDEETGDLDFENMSDELYNSENISTRFMKMLGYEGINVGTTSFDGLGQGNVLFDFKSSDIVGYFDSAKTAIQDYQSITKQLNGSEWVGSIDQLKQYDNNIDAIIKKLRNVKSHGMFKDTTDIDNTLDKLTQIKANVGKILSGEELDVGGEFKEITLSEVGDNEALKERNALLQEEVSKKQQLLDATIAEKNALDDQLSQERYISDELGQRAVDEEFRANKEKARADEIAAENAELKEQLAIKQQIKTVDQQQEFDGFEKIKQELGNEIPAAANKAEQAIKSVQQASNTVYSGTVYHGSKLPLDNVTYDVSKSKGMRNLGDGIYYTPDLELAAKHGKNILQQKADLDKVFILTKDFITDIDTLYDAMGKVKPEKVNWATIKKDLHGAMQIPENAEKFAKKMQELGYQATYSKGYGYADENAEQLVVYDENYKQNLTTTPYDEIKNSAKQAEGAIESAAVAQERLNDAQKEAKLYETSSGQMAMFDNMVADVQKVDAEVEELIDDVRQLNNLDGQTSLFDNGYIQNIQKANNELEEHVNLKEQSNRIESKSALDMARDHYIQDGRYSDKQIDFYSQKMIDKMLTEAFHVRVSDAVGDPNDGKMHFSKAFSGGNTPENIAAMRKEYELYDKILQKIGYHLAEWKDTSDSGISGFSAEIVKDSEKAIANFEEARDILYGINQESKNVNDQAIKEQKVNDELREQKELIESISNAEKTIGKKNLTPDPTPSVRDPSDPDSGGYALESTLQQTNAILHSIDGSMSKEAAKKTIPINDFNLNDINAAVLSKAAGFGSDIKLGSFETLKDGMRKVEGAFKNADGVWEGFTAKVNEANQVVKIGTQAQSAFADVLNGVNAEVKKAKTSVPSIKAQEDKYAVRMNEANELSGSSKVVSAINEYKQALDGLRAAQAAFNNTDGLSADDLHQLNNNFAIAKSKCEEYGKALDKLVNANKKFKESHENTNPVSASEYDDAENTLRKYVETVYGAEAKIEGFDASLKQLNFTFKDSSGAMKSMAASFDATGTAIGAAANKAKASTSIFGSLMSDIGSKAKSLMTYFTARFGVDELFQQVRKGVEYVREIDSALTELKKVTDETDATYQRFLQNASKTAGVIGSTVAELTTMTADWARLGNTLEDAAKLAETTAVLLNVSEFTDATQASEALISTIQAFGYTADESMHVVDILNEVGNNYAVSSDGLATALQTSASALMEGGNNLEKSSALVAAANKVVQDPSQVGSALRTISLRLRGTSLEVLQEMGEETDGVIEGVSKMQAKIKAASGVDILTEAGEYKDTYTILYEIGQVWEKMSDVNQAALLELLAGKNRANVLAAILGNMEDLENAYKDAMAAEGSALKENEAYLNSIQGRVDLFTNALQTFWMNLISSDVAKGIVDLGTTLIQLLDTLHGKILLIGAAFAGVKIHDIMKKTGNSFTTVLGESFDIVVTKIKDLPNIIKTAFSSIGTFTKNVINSIKLVGAATSGVTKADLGRALASAGVSKTITARIIGEANLAGVTGNLTKQQIANTVATLNEARANGTLTTSQYLAAMSTMGLKTALQGLWTVLKASPLYVVAAAVAVAALAFDKFTTTAQEASDAAKGAFDEIQSVVEATESTIQSLESELSSIADQINALDGKKLSFAEEQELKKLEAQRAELEHQLKVQEQLLELQTKSRNEQAVVAAKAYTKAASEGAEETQKTAKTWGTIAGIAGGVGVALAPFTGGTSLGVTAALGAAGGLLGNKLGEWAGGKASENDGSYDAWYETYTKALKTAREEEQKALRDYQKDSSNIDKLNKWQEAQQKTNEIETQMYDHLSQIQQYFNGIEYGVSEEMDKELDTWNNFFDKMLIDQGASGSEVTALDRIFGPNASEETQLIKNQILDAIAAGEDFDFATAINGSQELKDTLDYVGLSAEDVKNYFTQIGEAAAVAATGPDINPVETYSSAKAAVESYNDILSQTSEILGDNTLVTQEYKDSIIDLVGSEEAVNQCFDSNNKLIVTNAKKLKDLVAQNIRLEKAQSQLDYYNLVKQLNDTLDGTKQLDAVTRDSMHTLLNQIDTVSQAIYQYQQLEDSLLGARNAFDEFAKAQEIDSLNTYGDSYVEMAQVMYDALYKTGQVGTEAFEEATKALIDPSAYAHLDPSKQMAAIKNAFKNTVLPTLTLESDSLSLEYGNIKNFVQDALDKGVFTGTIADFDLVEGMNLEKAAELLVKTETQAYALFAEFDKYNTNMSKQSMLSQLDDSLEGRIMNITSNVEELNRQKLALLEDGGYEKNKEAIDAINQDLAAQSANMKSVGEEAYQMWQQYAQNDTAINSLSKIEDKQQQITEQAAKAIGVEWDEVKGKTVQQVYDELLAKQLELGTPTELTVQFAKDNIDIALEDLESKLKEKDIDVEANIVWNEEGERWETKEGSKYAGDADVQEYVNLKNDQYALEQYLDSGLTSTETYLKSIENILQGIYDYQTGKKDTDAIAEDTSDSKTESTKSSKDKKDKSFGDFWESINNFGSGLVKDVSQFATEDLPQFFADIGVYGEQLVQGINTFFSETIPQAVDSFWTFVSEKVSNVQQFADGVSTKIDEFFSVTFPQAWDDFWTSVGDFTTETLAPALGRLWTKITHIPEILNNWGADVVDGIKSFFTETLPQFFENVNNWGANVATKIKEFFSVTIPQKAGELVESAKQVFEGINNWGAEVSQKIQDFFGVTVPQKARELLDGAEQVFASVNNWGADVASKIQDFFAVTIPAKFDEFVDGIESGIEGINNWGADLAGKVKSLFTEIIPDWWERFKEGFKKGQNEEETRYQSDKANDVLKEEGVTDYTFNINSDNLDDIYTQIQEAQKALYQFVNTDGTLEVNAKGCEEAQVMLATLISKKQALETPAILKVDTSSSSADIQEVMGLINQFKEDYNTLELQAAVGADTTEAQAQLNTTISALQATNPEILAKLGIDPLAAATDINAAINGITPTLMINAGVNPDAVNTFKAENHDIEPQAIWQNITNEVETWMAENHDIKPKVIWQNDDRLVRNKTFTATGKVIWDDTNGPNDVNGTAHSRGTAHVKGTAYKGGSWGAPRTETALTGELGPELIVRGSRWFTVGDHGAEFTDIQKGDIIFNHKQTESLLKHGYVTGRGKAYASGTAYGNGLFDVSSPSGDTSKSSSKKKSNSSNKSDSTEDATEQIVDFIEIKLEEIEDIISKTSAEIENMVDDTTQLIQTNSAYDKLVDAENNKAETYFQAAKVYADRASELLNEIPEEYKEMAKNGAIAIEDFIGEDQAAIADAINEYREYAQKADSAELGYLEAIAQKSALRVEQLEKIASNFDNLIGWVNTESDLLQAEMDLVEESGERLSEKYYKELIQNSKEQLNHLTNEKQALQNALNDAVQKGDIIVGDQPWYDAIQQIADVDKEIIQCRTDMEEFNNSINDLKWDNLEKLMDQFGAIDDELSHLYDRFTDNDDVVDESGNWNSKGIAALGVAAQQMELAQVQAQKYGKAIEELQRDYKNGLYSTDEYNEKLAELKENQWDSIEAYEDAKDAIVDLNKTRVDAVKDGMEKELDAYKELIDKKKEALDADKDLYDFEKSVNEQQKEISDIRRELLAISGNTSMSAAAKRAELNAELAKAEAELADTYYEHSIDSQKDALDASYEYSEERTNKEIELLEKSLEDEEKLVTDSLNTVKSNANTVLSEINDLAKTYGIEITDSIVSPWETGVGAISSYKDSFMDLSDSFAQELKKIVDVQNQIQTLADSDANQKVEAIKNSMSVVTSATKKEESKPEVNNNKNNNKSESTGSKEVTKGQSVVVKKTATHFSAKSKNLKMASFVPGGTYTAMQVSGDQILIGKKGVATGWVKKSDLEGYAKGTTGVKNDQFAWIDEVGEELVLHAGSDGKLAYLTKGSSVIPSDLTEKLMKLAVDPTQTLEYSRPVINAPHITNNEINIDMNFGSVVHIDTVTNDTIPDLTKAVEKQMDKYVKNMNAKIRKYTR